MYFYDYETTFLAKGHKREEQQLLEVGIVRGGKRTRRSWIRCGGTPSYRG